MGAFTLSLAVLGWSIIAGGVVTLAMGDSDLLSVLIVGGLGALLLLPRRRFKAFRQRNAPPPEGGGVFQKPSL